MSNVNNQAGKIGRDQKSLLTLAKLDKARPQWMSKWEVRK